VSAPEEEPPPTPEKPAADFRATREKLRNQLREGKLDNRTVEIDVREKMFPTFEIISGSGLEEMDINVKDMLPGFSEAAPQAGDEGPGAPSTSSRRKTEARRHGRRSGARRSSAPSR
jgi:hypothetical protein